MPKSTEVNNPLPKKAIFDKFKPNTDDRKLFDEQISRLTIVGEISPQTVNITAGTDVASIYIILVTLKTADCHKKNIALLSKLIEQKMLFVLQYKDIARLAAYRCEKVLMSEGKPINKWKLALSGLDLGVMWENIIAEVGGIDLTGGKDLDAAIAKKDRREKLQRQITALEKKAMNERQPRRKWELAEKVKRLKKELEDNPHE
ncbi:MAG: DUF4391 domain-containing protein [Candidatus Syntrophopropionicum ammoniitolerans]